MIFEPGKNISRHILHQCWYYTCTIGLPVCWNPQHRSLLTVVSATSTPPFQDFHHQRNVCHKGGCLVDQTDGSHPGPSSGCKEDVQEVLTVVLEFSSGLLGLCGVWHCHDEAVTLLPGGLDVFCEKHPEASTVRCRITQLCPWRWTKFKEPSNSECHTPSSEPFRIQVRKYMPA
jgi:hypothetical protein